MACIESVTIEADDPTTARAFYDEAFGLGARIGVRAAGAPTRGFRAFTLSLIVAQPADADLILGDAVAAGATALRPAAKSMWGYGGVVQAPDGTIWKVATPKKKNAGPPSRQVEDIVLLLGCEDIAASKRFYTDRGFEVAKSFPKTYAEFAMPGSPVTLALYTRRGLAKDAGVAPDGAGSHRLAIGGDGAPFTDPDGFAWETATTARVREEASAPA